MRRRRGQRVLNGLPRMKFPKAAVVQPVGSKPRAEWPVCGATTSRARRNWAATRRAFSTGVRRSSSPSISSTGTSGSGPGPKAGAGAAAGQRPHSSTRSLSTAVARSNGENADPGRAAATARACARRSPSSGGLERGHGKRVSSQVVAV
jgi:hypothetical protein